MRGERVLIFSILVILFIYYIVKLSLNIIKSFIKTFIKHLLHNDILHLHGLSNSVSFKQT